MFECRVLFLFALQFSVNSFFFCLGCFPFFLLYVCTPWVVFTGRGFEHCLYHRCSLFILSSVFISRQCPSLDVSFCFFLAILCYFFLFVFGVSFPLLLFYNVPGTGPK